MVIFPFETILIPFQHETINMGLSKQLHPRGSPRRVRAMRRYSDHDIGHIWLKSGGKLPGKTYLHVRIILFCFGRRRKCEYNLFEKDLNLHKMSHFLCLLCANFLFFRKWGRKSLQKLWKSYLLLTFRTNFVAFSARSTGEFGIDGLQILHRRP